MFLSDVGEFSSGNQFYLLALRVEPQAELRDLRVLQLVPHLRAAVDACVKKAAELLVSPKTMGLYLASTSDPCPSSPKLF